MKKKSQTGLQIEETNEKKKFCLIRVINDDLDAHINKWLTNWATELLPDWVAHWVIDWPSNVLTNWLATWLADWQMN